MPRHEQDDDLAGGAVLLHVRVGDGDLLDPEDAVERDQPVVLRGGVEEVLQDRWGQVGGVPGVCGQPDPGRDVVDGVEVIDHPGVAQHPGEAGHAVGPQ